MTEQKWHNGHYAYLRVSTDQQDTENQATCVNQWIAEHGGNKAQQIEEEASTKKNWRERQLGNLLDDMPTDSTLVVSEVSRLARTTIECLEIFRVAAEKNITIVAVKNGLTMDGSMSSRIVSTVLAMAAEIERDMIRARTTEAIQRRKANGLPLGRPKGSTSDSKIDGEKAMVTTLLASNVSKSAIARVLQVSRNTLDRAIKKWEEAT